MTIAGSKAFFVKLSRCEQEEILQRARDAGNGLHHRKSREIVGKAHRRHFAL